MSAGQVTLRWSPPDGGTRRCRFGDVCTIGRAAHNRILLTEPSASRKHAELRLAAHALVARNVGSGRAFVVVGRGPVAPGESVELTAGDELDLAGQRFVVEAVRLPSPVAGRTVRCAKADCGRRIAAELADCPWCGTSTAFALTDVGGSS